MVNIVGTSIGILLSSIALTIGISSILLLSSKRILSTRDTLLRAYTVALLFLEIAFQIQMLFNNLLPFISLFYSANKMIEDDIKSAEALDVTLAVIGGLADGLLGWRCSMVQRVLSHGTSKWGNMFWVFPAFLWFVMIAMGITATALRSYTPWFSIVGASDFATNAALNLYATVFICARLLLHRRTILAHTGSPALTALHIHIVGILLESAAINLPVTIGCSVGIGMGLSLETTLLPITVANQALASVLIIHQVALGKVRSNTD